MNPFITIGDQVVNMQHIVRVYKSKINNFLYAVTIDGAEIKTRYTTFEEWALSISGALEDIMKSGFAIGTEFAKDMDRF